MKVVFFGTPSFAAETLTFLVRHGISVVAVVTRPDRPKGRSQALIPTPVKSVAQELLPAVPVYQPILASAPEFADTLKSHNADLFVVVAYGEIVKQHLLDIPPRGCINVHASLLPKYRGAAPIQRSIVNGEAETGVSIMHMVRKMDAGDIIAMARIPIEENVTYGELEQQLCHLGCKELLKVLADIERGVAERIPQDETQVTFAPKVELENTEVKWDRSAQELHNLIRGVTPHPGAWCYVQIRGQKKRLKLIASRVDERSGIPGAIIAYGNELVVAAGQGSLRLLEVQLEGKKGSVAAEFVRGIPVDQISFLGNGQSETRE